MTILTTDQLREHMETDLGDDALNRLASAAEAIIVGAIGTTTATTEYLEGGEQDIYTSRSMLTITSIKERDYPDDAETALVAGDYRKEGKFRIVRLREGDNSRLFWAPHVIIEYAPAVDADLLAQVQVNLVKLAAGFSGFKRESDGDFDFWHEDTAKETKAVLAQLTIAGMTLGIR